MSHPAPDSLWRNAPFQRLFWAHVVSLVGSGLGSVALGLLAHELVGASAAVVLGIALTIRIGVIVLCAPWAGFVADRLGARRTMVLSDLLRAAVVVGFFFAQSVGQIYALAVLLNLGAALFTPIYKSVIPGITTPAQYPRALALGQIAYDVANIAGPALAALAIATFGFRGNFLADAVTFLLSAALLFGLPGLAANPGPAAPRTSLVHGMSAMFRRPRLRETLLLALQTSVAGGFVLVATVDFVKGQLALPDTAYAWAMGAYGLGSVVGAALYGRAGARGRHVAVALAAPAMLVALGGVAVVPRFDALLVAWALAGAGQSVIGIRGNEILAAHTAAAERAHIYAAHFSLCHAGWGITYPLAGFLVTGVGFTGSAAIFAAVLTAVSLPLWLAGLRVAVEHRRGGDRHDHPHAAEDPAGDVHVHVHRHGDLVHSHPHRHDVPHGH